MTIQMANSKLLVDNLEIFNGVRLSEFAVGKRDYDIKFMLSKTLKRAPEQLYILSRNKNLMTNKMSPVLAKRAAQKSFNEIKIVNQIDLDEYIYQLFEVEKCSTHMLSDYRRDNWLLEGRLLSSDISALRKVFETSKLEMQVRLLLKHVNTCSRLWSGSPESCFQIFSVGERKGSD